MQITRTGKKDEARIIVQSSLGILGYFSNPSKNFFTGQNTIYIPIFELFSSSVWFLQNELENRVISLASCSINYANRLTITVDPSNALKSNYSELNSFFACHYVLHRTTFHVLSGKFPYVSISRNDLIEYLQQSNKHSQQFDELCDKTIVQIILKLICDFSIGIWYNYIKSSEEDYNAR